MYTVTDVRSVGGPNCGTDHFLVRVRCMNKMMKMQERCSKRTKWKRGVRVEDAIVNQKFKRNMVRRLVRQQGL